MKIKIISGSPRKESVSRRVALFLFETLKKHPDHEFELIEMRDNELPFFQQGWSKPEDVPEKWKALGEKMFEAEGYILVTPEYNGSYSPALKNMFDHFPKQSHKPFGIVTASDGALGGMRASQQMQLMIAALFGVLCPNMLIVPRMHEKFDAEGNLLDESFQKAVDVFLKEFLWLASKLD